MVTPLPPAPCLSQSSTLALAAHLCLHVRTLLHPPLCSDHACFRHSLCAHLRTCTSIAMLASIVTIVLSSVRLPFMSGSGNLISVFIDYRPSPAEPRTQKSTFPNIQF